MNFDILPVIYNINFGKCDDTDPFEWKVKLDGKENDWKRKK